jgi:hypothetical protein
MYEFEGDITGLRRALFERIESGETVLPSWFDEIRFMTWTFESVDEQVRPSHQTARGLTSEQAKPQASLNP